VGEQVNGPTCECGTRRVDGRCPACDAIRKKPAKRKPPVENGTVLTEEEVRKAFQRAFPGKMDRRNRKRWGYGR
jgi:hypothetical protein